MLNIIEKNFREMVIATYSAEPETLPENQLRDLRFAFFGGAMIVHNAIIECQKNTEAIPVSIQEEINGALMDFQSEIEISLKDFPDSDKSKSVWESFGRDKSNLNSRIEFPQKMFSPIGKKSNSGNNLYKYEIFKNFPIGFKICDFDKEQRLVEVEDNTGERSWLSLALTFKHIDFTELVKVKQSNDTILFLKFHSVGGSLSLRGREKLFLLFEVDHVEDKNKK